MRADGPRPRWLRIPHLRSRKGAQDAQRRRFGRRHRSETFRNEPAGTFAPGIVFTNP